MLSLRTRSGEPLVALSTASVFPDRVADAFEIAARLGYDGLDVMVSADITALYRVFAGRTTLAEALHRKQVRLEGSPADLRAFPQWFTWSPMADAVRVATADRQSGGVAIKPSSPHNKRMSA